MTATDQQHYCKRYGGTLDRLEVQQYFPSIAGCMVKPTECAAENARRNSPYVSLPTDELNWWLRSSERSFYGTYVNVNGGISHGSQVDDRGRVDTPHYGVRPAMWIKLDS